ncbi:MAG: FtsX-like permease family protein [Micromonospora sp.]
MRSVLIIKTRRDLRRRLAQFTAVAVTVLLGVLLYVASQDAYRNLRASYDQTYARLHFADLTATGPTADRSVMDVPGVAAVTTRTSIEVPLAIGADKLQGRIVGLPPDRQPAVDRVDVTAGRYLDPADPDGVLVERHAAATFGLSSGDRLRTFDGTRWRTLTVRGVAASPEYLWPARSRQDVLSDPHSFAVLFAAEPTARALAGSAAPHQTLVELAVDADPEASARIAGLLRGAGAVDVQTRADQPSHATLQEDLNGFSELAVAFPVLFLSAAGVAAYVLITRLVLTDRRMIGMLLAAGARRGRLVQHYLGHGMLSATAGATAGVALGVLATSAVTRAYTSALDVPDTVVRHHPSTLLLGLLLGPLVGAVAGLAPATAAVRTAPAEAMRGDTATTAHPGRWGRIIARARWLPVQVRMALRDVTRSRRRFLATMFGTVLALVLVLASVALVTSMRSMLDLQFDRIQRQDATVVAAPDAEDLTATLAGVPEVTAVEPAVVIPVIAGHAGLSYPTSLTGLPPDTTMHRFRTVDGGWRQLPADGLLAGAALADQLHVRVGQPLTVTGPDGASRQVRLAGLLAEPLGTALYGTVGTVRTLTGSGTNSYLLRFTPALPDPDRDRVRATISGLDGVVAYTDEQALRGQVDRYLGLFWVFIGVMLLLGAVLAFTVIYVTMTVNVAERITELASLRAAGVRTSRLAGLLATENLAATLTGVPVGLAAGALAGWFFLRSFSSDLFSLELTLGWAGPVGAATAVLAAAALSQLPAARAVRRLDVARVVRERAQ